MMATIQETEKLKQVIANPERYIDLRYSSSSSVLSAYSRDPAEIVEYINKGMVKDAALSACKLAIQEGNRVYLLEGGVDDIGAVSGKDRALNWMIENIKSITQDEINEMQRLDK